MRFLVNQRVQGWAFLFKFVLGAAVGRLHKQLPCVWPVVQAHYLLSG